MAKKNAEQDVKAAEAAAQNVKAGNSPDVLNFGETLGDNVERKLKFKPRPEFQNLCKGRLVEASLQVVKTETNDKNGLPSSWEYAGLELTSLKLSFIQEPTKEDPAERVYDHYFSPFTNVKKDGEALQRSVILNHYTEEYKMLRHIANAFKSQSTFDNKTPVPSLNPFIVDPIKRLENIANYYAYWNGIFNGTDGKGFATQALWLKIIASPEGTYLKFPSFVNEGFVEKVVEGRMPSIELKPSETVVLVKKERGAKGSAQANAAGSGGPAAGSEEPVSSEVEDLLKKYTS